VELRLKNCHDASSRRPEDEKKEIVDVNAENVPEKYFSTKCER
jgi:hypothetical protein